jgi:hypothetical protein
MKLFWALPLSFAVIIIMGCSVNSMSQNAQNSMNTVPDDFTVEYQWVAGSMPPPYHYEFLIRIKSSGQGEVVYWPDYSGPATPEWTERFTVSAEQLQQLFNTMKEQGLFTEIWQEGRHSVGGSYEFMTVVANGNKIKTPAFALPEQTDRMRNIYDALRVLPPKNIWTKLGAQRQKYMDSYEKKKR